MWVPPDEVEARFHALKRAALWWLAGGAVLAAVLLGLVLR
jgi:hypothetical protein